MAHLRDGVKSSEEGSYPPPTSLVDVQEQGCQTHLALGRHIKHCFEVEHAGKVNRPLGVRCLGCKNFKDM